MTHIRNPRVPTIQRYERDARRLVAMFLATSQAPDPWPTVLRSPGFLSWIDRHLAGLTSRATVRRYRAALLAISRAELGDIPEAIPQLPTGRNRAAAQAKRSCLSANEWKSVPPNLRDNHLYSSPWGAHTARLLELTLTIGVLPVEWADACLINSEQTKTLVLTGKALRLRPRALGITQLDETSLKLVDEVIAAKDQLGSEEWLKQANRVPWHLRHAAARLWGGQERRVVTLHAARRHFADKLAVAGWRRKAIAQALGLARLPNRRSPLVWTDDVPIIRITLAEVPRRFLRERPGN